MLGSVLTIALLLMSVDVSRANPDADVANDSEEKVEQGSEPQESGSAATEDGEAATDSAEKGAESGDGDGEASEDELRERLRELEAKYKETGNPKYKFERVLTLEKMGEHEFALDVLQEYRGDFESSDEVEGVAVVEQRLRDATGGAGSTDASSGGESTGRTRKGTDALGWALVAGGSAAAVGGVIPIAIAESRAQRLRCSPASEGPSADGCGDVEEFRGLSSSEFDQKSRSVTTLRILGIGLAAVGTGAAGWGIYRLATGPRSTATGRADAGVSPPTLRPIVTTRSAKLQLQFDF